MKYVMVLIVIHFVSAIAFIGPSAIPLSFILAFSIFAGSKLLNIGNATDLKDELLNHLFIMAVVLVGSVILPILVYLKSSQDIVLMVVVVLVFVPLSLVVGYLWFRFLDYLVKLFMRKLKA